MEPRESVHFSNASPKPLRVVIEPWGMEYMLPCRSSCEVVSVGGFSPVDIQLDDDEYGLIFWFNTHGAVFEYWQDGVFID